MLLFASMGGGGGSGGGGNVPPPPKVPELVKDLELPADFKICSGANRSLIVDKLTDQETLANIRKHLPNTGGDKGIPSASGSNPSGKVEDYTVADATVYLKDGSVATAIDTNGRNLALPADRTKVFPTTEGFLLDHAEPNAIGQLIQKDLNIDMSKPLYIVTDRVPCRVCLDMTDIQGQILAGADELGITEVRINYLDRYPFGDPNAGNLISSTPVEVIFKRVSQGWVK